MTIGGIKISADVLLVIRLSRGTHGYHAKSGLFTEYIEKGAWMSENITRAV